MTVFIVVRVVWFMDEHELTNEPVFATMDKKAAHDFAVELNMLQPEGDISVSFEVVSMELDKKPILF